MTRAADAYRAVLPAPHQWPLLRLAFGRDFSARAFGEWAATVDFDAAVGETEMRLLPLVGARLQQAGATHPLLPRIAGIRRRVAYRGQLVLHRGLALQAALAERGIDAVLLRGLAASLFAGPGAPMQPLADVELLLPRGADPAGVEAAAAARSLRRTFGMPGYHVFRDADGFSCRLYGVLRPHEGAKEEAAVWGRALRVAREGRTVLALSPEHHVFQAIWLGLDHDRRAGGGWAVEVLSALAAVERFDWDALRGLARESGSGEAVAAALGALLEHDLGTPGMREARDALLAAPGHWQDRRWMRLRAQPPRGLLRRTGRFLLPYLRDARRRGERPGPAGLLDYARGYWNVADSRAALAMAWRKATRPTAPGGAAP